MGGADGSLKNKLKEEKMLDLVVKKCLDPNYQPDVWFSSNIFMIFGLPTRKLKGNPSYWTKETALCKLTITRDEKYEIPYGCYARMNQIFIDTEVKTKNTNVIEVGKTFNEYVRRIGYKEGFANKALLRQLINYGTVAKYAKNIFLSRELLSFCFQRLNISYFCPFLDISISSRHSNPLRGLLGPVK